MADSEGNSTPQEEYATVVRKRKEKVKVKVKRRKEKEPREDGQNVTEIDNNVGPIVDDTLANQNQKIVFQHVTQQPALTEKELIAQARLHYLETKKWEDLDPQERAERRELRTKSGLNKGYEDALKDMRQYTGRRSRASSGKVLQQHGSQPENLTQEDILSARRKHLEKELAAEQARNDSTYSQSTTSRQPSLETRHTGPTGNSKAPSLSTEEPAIYGIGKQQSSSPGGLVLNKQESVVPPVALEKHLKEVNPSNQAYEDGTQIEDAPRLPPMHRNSRKASDPPAHVEEEEVKPVERIDSVTVTSQVGSGSVHSKHSSLVKSDGEAEAPATAQAVNPPAYIDEPAVDEEDEEEEEEEEDPATAQAVNPPACIDEPVDEEEEEEEEEDEEDY